MADRQPHLYLTGYRGTGKSSLAQLLAERLQRKAWDTDRIIEANAALSIREIFSSQGETSFRDLEEQALQEVSQFPPAVIALGGGAILRASNRQQIKATGRCVWLTADPVILWQRIQNDQQSAATRPALTAHTTGLAEVREVLAARQTLYREVADLVVTTDHRALEEIAAEIVQWWQSGAAINDRPSP